MNQIRYYLLAAVATMMIIGCTDDSMNQVATDSNSEEQSASTDEVKAILEAIPGVINVQLLPDKTVMTTLAATRPAPSGQVTPQTATAR